MRHGSLQNYLALFFFRTSVCRQIFGHFPHDEIKPKVQTLKVKNNTSCILFDNLNNALSSEFRTFEVTEAVPASERAVCVFRSEGPTKPVRPNPPHVEASLQGPETFQSDHYLLFTFFNVSGIQGYYYYFFFLIQAKQWRLPGS